MDLITAIIAELNAQGYSVLTNHVTEARDGDEIVGHMKLYKEGTDDSLPFCQMFAYMNSYNKHLPIKLVSGAHVFVCGNGMVVGEIFSYRKHTSGIGADLKNLIKVAVESIEGAFQKAINDTRLMQRFHTDLRSESELLGRIYVEHELISGVELNAAIAELRSPSFDSFKARTIWSLYNHLTYALKNAPPVRRMDSLKKVHTFLIDHIAPNPEYNVIFSEFE